MNIIKNADNLIAQGNSLQVIDSITLVSAKRIQSFDFATMYTNLSLNLVFENLKTVIKISFLLSSKRFLKIDTYNKKKPDG